MAVLVVAAHDGKTVRSNVANAVAAAAQMDADVHVLVAGSDAGEAAKTAAAISGVTKVLQAEDAAYAKPSFIFCSWTVSYKERRLQENPGRALKLTAENLFVTLGDPAAEPNPANTPLLQFLALLLERKRVLRPRGFTPDGERQRYEHTRTHLTYEIPTGTLDAAFFLQLQGQLDLLVGPAREAAEPQPAGA